jgi:ferredoxin
LHSSDGAPFGAIELNVEGCTLCLACVSACPTGALSDNPERPMLRFTEDACVQCGLCKATCPEKVITPAAARFPRRHRNRAHP